MVGSHGSTSQGSGRTLNPWHDASEHREKTADRNRGFAIEGKRAAPLTDYLSSAWLTGVDAQLLRARSNWCLASKPAGMPFDNSLFSPRLPRCDFDLIDDP